MAKISPSILSLEFFCKNSVYLRVRLRERFVNPQLLKQLAVYKIKEVLFLVKPFTKNKSPLYLNYEKDFCSSFYKYFWRIFYDGQG